MSKIPKQKLWKLAYETFREYIRKRDANFQGYARDPSDGKMYLASEMDIGHWRHGKGKECYFWETNCHLQAKKNNYYGGQDVLQNYTIWMIKTYGLKEVERIKKAKRIYWTNKKLEEVIEKYKKLLGKLKKC
jgi:hypothetical protein